MQLQRIYLDILARRVHCSKGGSPTEARHSSFANQSCCSLIPYVCILFNCFRKYDESEACIGVLVDPQPCPLQSLACRTVDTRSVQDIILRVRALETLIAALSVYEIFLLLLNGRC